MARRPQIPEDVFFDESGADRESEDAQRNDRSARSRRAGSGPRSYRRLSEMTGQRPEAPARVGRPPAQEGPKVAVTLYLTEPVAHLLVRLAAAVELEQGGHGCVLYHALMPAAQDHADELIGRLIGDFPVLVGPIRGTSCALDELQCVPGGRHDGDLAFFL